MDVLGCTAQYKVRQCFQCQSDTEFYCHICKHDLCVQCKERHAFDLHTKDHDIVIYREKFDYIPKQEACVRHPDRIYEKFCESCELSICFRCVEHKAHHVMDIRTAYQTKRQQHREIILNIRNETLFTGHVLLAGIKTDIQAICGRLSQVLIKAQRLKDLIDTVVFDVKRRYKRLLIERIQQQRRIMKHFLTHIQNYQDKYEQSANRAVQFLLFIKTSNVPRIKDTPNPPLHALLSLSEKFNMEDVSQLLREITEIKITTGKRHVGIDLSYTSKPELHKSVCVTGIINGVYHISCVTSDRIWMSDHNYNLILTDTTGVTIHHLTDITWNWYGGLHTVNSAGELIYIDSNDAVTKLSVDNKRVTILLKRIKPWFPRCVYYSPSSGDLFVGLWNPKTKKGKVTRFNSKGDHVLTIPNNEDESHAMYRSPWYITENRNGDVIVSEYIKDKCGAVVVTDHRGRYRFSYKGPRESPLRPVGICTDVLSNILVCDDNSQSVHLINKNGQFLSLLLTEQHGIKKPRSLGYDDKSHLLWVGSRWNKTVN